MTYQFKDVDLSGNSLDIRNVSYSVFLKYLNGYFFPGDVMCSQFNLPECAFTN